MKKRYIIIGIILSFLFVSFSFDSVHAKKTISDAGSALTEVVDRTGVSKADVPTISGEIIKNMLQLTSLVFFILLIYAGMKWMLAQGKEDEVSGARKTVVAASIGLFVVAGSYAITNFVTSRIIEGNENEVGFADAENADFTVVGCCFDKVRAPGNFAELRATTWAKRLTTYADCEEMGNKPLSFDEIYGPGTWQFAEVDSMQQCDNLYETFCEKEDCYDLGF